jgi:hypothetical protein
LQARGDKKMLLSELEIKNGRVVAKDSNFKESEHPRGQPDNAGQFAEVSVNKKAIRKERRLRRKAKIAELRTKFKELGGEIKEGENPKLRVLQKLMESIQEKKKEVPVKAKEIKEGVKEQIKYLKDEKEIKVGSEMGRGWFIAPDGDLIDVTSDFGGGTNDHVGMFIISGVGDKLKLPSNKIEKLKKMEDYINGPDFDFNNDEDLLDKQMMLGSDMINLAMKKGTIRVREFEGNYISIQGEGLSLNKIQALIEKNKIPSNKRAKYSIEGTDDHYADYVQTNLSVLVSSDSWRELKKRTTYDSFPEIDFQGLKISIENPQGSVREGKSPDGVPFRIEMKHPYGFICLTEGCDGEEIDCFVGPDRISDKVFVIWDKWQKEDKCFLGFENEQQAKNSFYSHYENPEKFFGPITSMSMESFKTALKKHKQGTRIE